MSGEVVKLVIILGIGAGIIAAGLYFQRKKKRESEGFTSGETKSLKTISDEENPKIKEYIETYKKTYDRESIKRALISSGYDEDELENHLNKYF